MASSKKGRSLKACKSGYLRVTKNVMVGKKGVKSGPNRRRQARRSVCRSFKDRAAKKSCKKGYVRKKVEVTRKTKKGKKTYTASLCRARFSRSCPPSRQRISKKSGKKYCASKKKK